MDESERVSLRMNDKRERERETACENGKKEKKTKE